jgi:hypothetical protein
MLVLALVGLYVQTQSLIYDMGVIVDALLLPLLTVHPPTLLQTCTFHRVPTRSHGHPSTRIAPQLSGWTHRILLYIQPFHFSTHSRYLLYTSIACINVHNSPMMINSWKTKSGRSLDMNASVEHHKNNKHICSLPTTCEFYDNRVCYQAHFV